MSGEDKIHYRRNVLISIIIGEAIIIAAFLFSPKNSSTGKIILSDEPFKPFDEMPITVQSLPATKQKPEVPAIYISDDIESFKILDDVDIVSNGSGKSNTVSQDGKIDNNIVTGSSVPRLIYEIVPAEGENKLSGRLQISLKINEEGEVTDHRIIFNSLDCVKCLNDIINAAYKSKWEPAIVDGRREEYWVVREFVFN